MLLRLIDTSKQDRFTPFILKALLLVFVFLCSFGATILRETFTLAMLVSGQLNLVILWQQAEGEIKRSSSTIPQIVENLKEDTNCMVMLVNLCLVILVFAFVDNMVICFGQIMTIR